MDKLTPMNTWRHLPGERNLWLRLKEIQTLRAIYTAAGDGEGTSDYLFLLGEEERRVEGLIRQMEVAS